MQNSISPQLLEKVQDLAVPLAASLGLEIWGLELSGGVHPVLRVFANLASEAEPKMPEELNGRSVDVESLASLSRMLSLGLEVEDLFHDAWTLEISSPGLERPFFRLEQLKNYLNKIIEVNLLEPVESDPIRKKYIGCLTEVRDCSFSLLLDLPGTELDGTTLEIIWSLVKKAHLVHIFDNPQKPGRQQPNQKHGA